MQAQACGVSVPYTTTGLTDGRPMRGVLRKGQRGCATRLFISGSRGSLIERVLEMNMLSRP